MKSIWLTDKDKSYDVANKMFLEADSWAKDNCSTYIDFTVTDVSDVSYDCDQIARYRFERDEDATMFILMWS
jgi:hypothetical protein